jgi:hypothetical protein
MSQRRNASSKRERPFDLFTAKSNDEDLDWVAKGVIELFMLVSFAGLAVIAATAYLITALFKSDSSSET